MDIISTLVITVIGGLAVWFIIELVKRSGLRNYKQNKAPLNILEHVYPGVTLIKAQEILGAPYIEDKNILIYKFSNLFVQLSTQESKSVSAVTKMLPSLQKHNKFKVYPLNYVLGELKFGDQNFSAEDIILDSSSKFVAAWVELYFGNPGYYRDYTFGIFSGAGVRYEDEKLHLYLKDKMNVNHLNKLIVKFVSVANKEGIGRPIHFEYLR